ncbi:MAG: peptidoglycan DD-metalloendopeptidase family protein [Ignavibacteria bacterium]|nr:peptidoglycan DD-metalloendopeptidase family protein [Ignavibacteria bacterium]
MPVKRKTPAKPLSLRNKSTSVKKPAVNKGAAVKIKTAGKSSGVTVLTKTVKVKNVSPGIITRIRHHEFKKREPVKIGTGKISGEILKKLKDSPSKVEITLEPKAGEYLVYHPTPGFTSQDKPLAQLSVLAFIYNKGTKSIDLDEMELEYKLNGQTVKTEVYLPSDQMVIDPWYVGAWQNSRDYHEPGDIAFLEAPFPDKVTVKFHFKGYSDPLSVTKNLIPYNLALSLPFKASDFGKDEYVTGYSMHGGGEQVFAYDVGVQKYENNAWSDLYPDKDWTKNAHYRIWGKPVYAMADGVVLHFENNIPNNTVLDGSDENLEKQKNDYWGSFDYGGSGNHFYIRHGDVVALYAHLQKGSLNSKFTTNGKIVKKGDFLGLAGNSGNSTGPHLHIHIKTFKNANEPEGGIFRPLLFNNGYVIGQANYPKPKSNINWSKLDKKGIPGLKGKACFVHPSGVHPYCEYPTNWGEVCRFGVPENIYQQEFEKVWPCGYYPVWVDGYDKGGKTYFNVIFRPSKNIQWVARHNMDDAAYKKEFKIWDDAGYRLININSYLLKGKIRYAAVWIYDSSVSWFAYHGKTLAWHESNFENNQKGGFVPANVSCVYSGGETYVTALWEKKNTGGFYLRPVMSLKEFTDAFKQYSDKEKFKIAYLDAYVKGGKPVISCIWYKNIPGYNSWWEKYHLNESQFQTEYNAMLDSGYLTRCIAGYSDGGIARFESVFSK